MTRIPLLLAMMMHAGMAVDTLNKCWAVCGKAPAPYNHALKWQTQGFRNKREAKSGDSDGGSSGSASGEDSLEDSTERKKKKNKSVNRISVRSTISPLGVDASARTTSPDVARNTTITMAASLSSSSSGDPLKGASTPADNATRIDDQDTRIVNGYDPDDRPWLALLDVSGGSCGGALINKRYILSAAHCYCRQSPPIMCEEVMIEGKLTHRVSYDTKKHVKIYLGVNNMPLAKKDKDPNMLYRVTRVVIRSGWIFGKTFTPDLSISRLERDVEFTSSVGPICLPPSAQFADVSVQEDEVFKAYVAGWGASFSQCDSNKNGPSPNAMCKFPYSYDGKDHDHCSKAKPPSSQNKVCEQFYKWAKKMEPSFVPNDPEKVFSIFLWDEKGEEPRQTTCYATDPGKFGWCGTCYNGELQPGDEGYCDKYQGNSELKSAKESGKPTFDQNWGWCSDWCDNKDGPAAAQKLQETQLDILTESQCAYFGKALETNATIELCSGKKSKFPLIHQFRRVITKENKIKFENMDPVINRLGLPESKYDFFLGGTDSCQGDSGGPLFRWYSDGEGDSRAFIIGAVSRGTGCANFNQPGIFSRIRSHLDWITKETQDGNC